MAHFAALSADTVARNLERVRERIAAAGGDPDAVEICAAIKYVPVEQLGALAEGGIELVGENRAQDLAGKQDRYGDAFRWHFIGHLQSRKAKDVSARCELVHSLDSSSAAKRLTAPALVEVNLSGEESKSGVDPSALPAFLDEVRGLGADVRGLMTMPPLADDPEDSRRYFRRLRELAGEHGLAELSMGTSQDVRVAVEEGATLVRVGSALFGR